MTIPIQLQAADIPVIANAGDDITLPFTVLATNTTGWTLAFLVYRADASGTGPDGDSIGSGTVTNTPGSPNSSVSVTVAAAVTASYGGKKLWVTFRRTDSGSARTLATGQWDMR